MLTHKVKVAWLYDRGNQVVIESGGVAGGRVLYVSLFRWNNGA